MSRRLVVEADGGSRGNPGPAAYGALVRDADTGQVLATDAKYLGVASNNVAEYGGLIAGLRLAVGIDPAASVEVRMDSKLVVEQMSGRWQLKHEDMRRLAAQARTVVDPAQVRYTWVPRARNAEADRLANEALDDAADGRGWRGAPTTEQPADPTGASVQHTLSPATVPAPAVDLGEPTTLVLLRHGVTEFTEQRRFSGRGGRDLGLSPTGLAQAAAAAEAVEGGGGVDAIVSSPLRRTRETAQVVADRLGLPVVVDEDWVECAFGQWDGLTSTEVEAGWPQEFAAWQGSVTVAPPGGEPFEVVEQRVRRAWAGARAVHAARRVLVVTHSTPIKQLVRLTLGAGPQTLWRLDSTPASLTSIRCWADGGASLASFNETGHLHARSRA